MKNSISFGNEKKSLEDEKKESDFDKVSNSRRKKIGKGCKTDFLDNWKPKINNIPKKITFVKNELREYKKAIKNSDKETSYNYKNKTIPLKKLLTSF